VPERGVAEVTLEALYIQPDRSRDLEQGALVNGWLAREERVVHLPESTLPAGSLGADGGQLGTRMGSLVRKMPEYVGHSLTEGTPEPFENAFQSPTIGTEKIAVDQDRQRVGRSVSPECDHFVDRAAEGACASRACALRSDLWRASMSGFMRLND